MEKRNTGAGRGVPASQPITGGRDVVVEVIKAAGIAPNTGIGNFPDNEARTTGLRALFALKPCACHCKHNPDRYSLSECIQIAKDAGYGGIYSAEGGGGGARDPYQVVQTILDELLKEIG